MEDRMLLCEGAEGDDGDEEGERKVGRTWVEDLRRSLPAPPRLALEAPEAFLRTLEGICTGQDLPPASFDVGEPCGDTETFSGL